MSRIKHIPRPQLKNATLLTPMQLNRLRCSVKHTVLTPEQLARMKRNPNN